MCNSGVSMGGIFNICVDFCILGQSNIPLRGVQVHGKGGPVFLWLGVRCPPE